MTLFSKRVDHEMFITITLVKFRDPGVECMTKSPEVDSLNPVMGTSHDLHIFQR